LSGCTQWHSKGVYGLPYRCYYSKNITNLFLAGRIISATHVAFGTTRVMGTCSVGAQAVAVAAAICKKQACLPRDIGTGANLAQLQTRLLQLGQHLPGKVITDTSDLASRARITASSTLQLSEIRGNAAWISLDHSWAMLLPLAKGTCPTFTYEVESSQPGPLKIELRRSLKPGGFTPEELIETVEPMISNGTSLVTVAFRSPITREGYHFIKLCEKPGVRVRASDERFTGILSVTSAYNKAVATSSIQSPPPGIGIDTFEFWLPKRRPHGTNLAMKIHPPIACFGSENVAHGPSRPTEAPNAWVADPTDPEPSLLLEWPEPVTLTHVILEFDPDWDHPMESVLMTHPEEVVPFMVKDFDLLDAADVVIASLRDHHGAHVSLKLAAPLRTSALKLKIFSTHGAPAAVFRVRVFGS
jgi:hypothetical protein